MIFASLSAIFTMMAMTLPIPILPLYAISLGATLAIVGLIAGGYGLTQFILKLPIGVWSDRAGRRKIFIAAGLFIAAAGGLGLMLSTNPWQLMMSRILQGFGVAMIALFTVIFSNFYPPEKRPTATALAMGFIGTGAVLGTFFTSILVGSIGYNGIFLASTICAFVAGLLALAISETRIKVETTITLKRLAQISKIPLVYLPSTGLFLLTVAYFGVIMAFFPVYATSLNINQGTIAIMMATASLAYALFNFIGGPLTEKAGHKRILLTGSILVGLSAIALPFITAQAELFIACFVVSMGYGLTFPAALTLALAPVLPREFATSNGIFFTIYSFGIIVGPMIVGLLAGLVGLQTTLIIAGIIALLALIPFLRIKLG